MNFLLVLFLTVPVYAQTNSAVSYTIKGQVIDSLANETVPYATLNIVLANAPQQSVKMLACDDDGKFETTLKAPGNYVLITQYVGKVPAHKSFTVKEGDKTVDLGQIMISDDTQRIAEVTVTAQKPLVKVEIDKIVYSLEDDPEAQTNNTLDMLRKVPMVTVDGEDKIQLKGSSNYKIYLNGKPSNMLSSDNASDVLKSMPASSIKNIEVITDPGARYDAEGIGGIINIITTKNALQGYTGTVNAEVSSFGSFRGGGYFTTKIGKVGLTANYNYMDFKRPWSDSESYRENYGDFASQLTQTGRSKSKGPRQFGSFEFSYEIDTLNLLSINANIWGGSNTSTSEMSAVQTSADNPLWNYQYDRHSKTKFEFGSVDVGLDYQHSTRKKDELLTLSYKFSNSPNNSEGHTYLHNVINYYDSIAYPRWSINDAYTREHTAQVDYTTPTFKDQTLEAGLKYIMRQSDSETKERILNEETQQWRDSLRPMRDFKHTQHIYSAYLSYAMKFNKFGAKVGVRAEGTALKAKFADTPEANFDTDYFNLVPNATLSYQINMAQQLRLGYNMRIHRPGIWHLNPYVNRDDPQFISYGNPNLRPEKSHGINFNYSMFTQKFNFNANLSYHFVNNSIERYSFKDEETGVNVSTYDNIGKNQSIGMFLYGRWNPVPLFNISLNGGMDYTDINGEDWGMSNSGWSGRLFANAQFNLPKDFNINLNGGYFSPWIQLQAKQSGYYFTGISVGKGFMKRKLNVRLSCQSPFEENLKFKNTTTASSFYSRSTSYMPMREVRLSVSYRFGTLKDSIKKVRRGITNDDTKGGGGDTGGGGGGQTM
ncbi:outer membrane receptor protein involved in Fe transport [Parabacteroides sp. PF5-6]|nr:outer membrane receptor protein involved in Fe transport [Parabacteroides sp. PF5-6]